MAFKLSKKAKSLDAMCGRVEFPKERDEHFGFDDFFRTLRDVIRTNVDDVEKVDWYMGEFVVYLSTHTVMLDRPGHFNWTFSIDPHKPIKPQVEELRHFQQKLKEDAQEKFWALQQRRREEKKETK